MSTQATVSTRTQRTAAGGVPRLDVGVALFAASLVAIGVTCLNRGGIAAVWSGVPKNFPGRSVVITLCAVISIASGIGALWRRSAAVTARVLLAWMAAWMVAFRIPLVFRAPTATDAWWATGETAAMMAGAWLLYAKFARDRGDAKPDFLTNDNGVLIARVLYGLALIPFGVAHFTYLQHTADTVPSWLPWHVGWACFTGGSLIAAGVAIVTGVLRRLAATLTAWEMTLFTVLVWVPIVVRGPDAGQWDEFVDSCVLTGVAWLVADSCSGLAWLGLGRGQQAATPKGGRPVTTIGELASLQHQCSRTSVFRISSPALPRTRAK
jgi:uncharacterized membrane protein YphA (DoxX/SURF4 family)